MSANIRRMIQDETLKMKNYPVHENRSYKNDRKLASCLFILQMLFVTMTCYALEPIHSDTPLRANIHENVDGNTVSLTILEKIEIFISKYNNSLKIYFSMLTSFTSVVISIFAFKGIKKQNSFQERLNLISTITSLKLKLMDLEIKSKSSTEREGVKIDASVTQLRLDIQELEKKLKVVNQV